MDVTCLFSKHTLSSICSLLPCPNNGYYIFCFNLKNTFSKKLLKWARGKNIARFIIYLKLDFILLTKDMQNQKAHSRGYMNDCFNLFVNILDKLITLYGFF